MGTESHDPRDIPILTDAVDKEGQHYALMDAKAVQGALVSEALRLAESLLEPAAKHIEALLHEHVLEQLRAQLPALVERIIAAHAPVSPTPRARNHGFDTSDGLDTPHG